MSYMSTPTFDPLSPAERQVLIVQNSLNNQDIKALTTINATVNTLGLYKALNLQSTLSGAIANSVGTR